MPQSRPGAWEPNPAGPKGGRGSAPGAWANPGNLGLTAAGRNVGPLFLRSPDRIERGKKPRCGGSSAPDGSTSQQGYTNCQESSASKPPSETRLGWNLRATKKVPPSCHRCGTSVPGRRRRRRNRAAPAFVKINEFPHTSDCPNNGIQPPERRTLHKSGLSLSPARPPSASQNGDNRGQGWDTTRADFPQIPGSGSFSWLLPPWAPIPKGTAGPLQPHSSTPGCW